MLDVMGRTIVVFLTLSQYLISLQAGVGQGARASTVSWVPMKSWSATNVKLQVYSQNRHEMVSKTQEWNVPADNGPNTVMRNITDLILLEDKFGATSSPFP